jgi:deoxyribonuclease-4
MPLLGAHQSIAGGLHLAFDRIAQVGGESLQIFTANQRQWKAKTLTDEEIRLFQETWQRHDAMPVASHASYLINLAADDPEKAEKSIVAFSEELSRCHRLGIELVVIHPGSHGGRGIDAGLETVTRNLEQVLDRSHVKDSALKILLETTAGQGTSLGSRFEELGVLLRNNRYPQHLGVCVDTCHIFAAGYDIRHPHEYDQTVNALATHIGLDQIHLFHLNDSQKDCGSRVDRHAHIGEGYIGLEGFGLLLNDQRFRHLPMTLETDKGVDLAEDIENLQRLRALLL